MVGATTIGTRHDEPIVITGIGMLASVAHDREGVWQAVQQGKSGVRLVAGLPGVPDFLRIAAPVLIEPNVPGELKVVTLAKWAAAEAIADSRVDLARSDLSRFGCAISGHIGDTTCIDESLGRHDPRGRIPYWRQWLPNTACALVANQYGLLGPRMVHSVACASGLVDVLSAVRNIRDGQCDMVLCGSAEGIHPLMAAGFQKMRVLADHEDPEQACRPFDSGRRGFVMGEGAAMFVVERLSHALRRGAHIYAEILSGRILSEGHHITDLDVGSNTLCHLITESLRDAGLTPRDLGYINAHGTATKQNDLAESRGIRRALGSAADHTCVSASKSMLGHLVIAAGSVELAITTLALRDGFAPPTVNLTDPDPQCDLDCIPLTGRPNRIDHAMKISVAFGGHLVAVVLRRWNDANSGFGYPLRKAA